MSRRLLAAALALALPLPGLALEALVVQKIQFRIAQARPARGDVPPEVEAAQAAFDRLVAAGVLVGDDQPASVEPTLEITRRVLDAGDPGLVEALATLVSSGALSGLLPDQLLPEPAAPAPPPGPTPADRVALETAQRNLDRCMDELGKIEGLVAEFNNSFFGRKKVLLRIHDAITQASDLLSRAADQLKRARHRDTELFEATRQAVLETSRLVKARIQWFERVIQEYNGG